MNKQREALQLALEALRITAPENNKVVAKAQDLIREALAKQEQEPARTPLTDDEIQSLWKTHGYKSALCMKFARALEKKIRGES